MEVARADLVELRDGGGQQRSPRLRVTEHAGGFREQGVEVSGRAGELRSVVVAHVFPEDECDHPWLVPPRRDVVPELGEDLVPQCPSVGIRGRERTRGVVEAVEWKAGQPVEVSAAEHEAKGALVGRHQRRGANRVRPHGGDERKVSRVEAAGAGVVVRPAFADRHVAIDDTTNDEGNVVQQKLGVADFKAG